jgi:hypothetical protein
LFRRLSAGLKSRPYAFLHFPDGAPALRQEWCQSVGAEGTVQPALVGIPVTPELEVIFDTVSSLAEVREPDGAAGVLGGDWMGRGADGAV